MKRPSILDRDRTQGNVLEELEKAKRRIRTLEENLLTVPMADRRYIRSQLTDYSNVIVVDPAGFGDFTTLRSAINSITDASPTNRYEIWGFGRTTETGNITWKSNVDLFGGEYDFQNVHYFSVTDGTTHCDFHGATFWAAEVVVSGTNTPSDGREYGLNFYNCLVWCQDSSEHNVALFSNNNGGFVSSLRLVGCTFLGGDSVPAVSLTGNGTGNILFQACEIHAADEYGLGFNTPALCRVLGSAISSVDNAGCVLNDDALFEVTGCAIRGDAAGILGGASEPAAASIISNCDIIGITNSISFSSAPTWARVHHCLLVGALNNFTPEAGTARGSNIEV